MLRRVSGLRTGRTAQIADEPRTPRSLLALLVREPALGTEPDVGREPSAGDRCIHAHRAVQRDVGESNRQRAARAERGRGDLEAVARGSTVCVRRGSTVCLRPDEALRLFDQEHVTAWHGA